MVKYADIGDRFQTVDLRIRWRALLFVALGFRGVSGTWVIPRTAGPQSRIALSGIA